MPVDPSSLNIIFDDDAFIITTLRLNNAAPVVIKNVTSIQVTSDIDVELHAGEEVEQQDADLDTDVEALEELDATLEGGDVDADAPEVDIPDEPEPEPEQELDDEREAEVEP